MAVNKRKILEAARKYAQKGSKDRALKEYERLLKLDPRDAKLRLEIGDTHRRWGQVDEAIDTYTKVAEQYTKEGFDARAVAVYKQIQNLDPERTTIYEPLSDLYQRMGLSSEAINALQTAADCHYRQGNKREALDLLRKMSGVDPTNTNSRIKVADLLVQENLTEEAFLEYDEVAAELERQSEMETAETIYERILEIEPKRVSTLESLARNLLVRQLPERAEAFAARAVEVEPDAPERYEQLAEVYRVQQREDALTDVYRKLADLYRGRGDEDRAREILQRYAPPEELSANATTDPNFAEERFIQDAAIGGNAEFLQEDLLEENLPEEPEDGMRTLLVEDLASEPASEADVATQVEIDIDGDAAAEAEGFLDDPEEPLLEDEPILEIEAPEIEAPEIAAPEFEPEIEEPKIEAPDLVPQGDPEQLLAEASVYLRYGKADQAIANLEAVVVAVPENRIALARLGEAYAATQQSSRAVETWLRAAELARGAGDAVGVDSLRRKIVVLDDAAARGLEPAAGAEADPFELEAATPLDLEDSTPLEFEEPAELELELEEEAALPPDEAEQEPAGESAAPDVEDAFIDEIELDEIELDMEEPSIDEISLGEPIAAEGAPASAATLPVEPEATDGNLASASVSTSQQIMEDLEEADFYMQQSLMDEAERIYQRVLAVAPSHPHVLVRLGEIAAARGGDPSATSDAPGESQEATLPGDLELSLDGAEFAAPEPEEELAPPVVDPAPEVESDAAVLGSDVDVDELVEDLALDLDDHAEPPVPPQLDLTAPADEEPADGAGGLPFDLAAELSDALDEDSRAVTSGGASGTAEDACAAYFRDFKKGVSETLEEGDHQTRYDLGIAYREMGLIDDAIGEFQIAMQGGALRVECLHMLGLCSLDAGRADEAVACFDQALGSDRASPEQRLAARFERGRGLEALGDREGARAAYEAVAAQDASFCQVQDRLAELSGGAPAGDPGDAEDFVSFEDILAESSDSEVDEGSGAPDAPAAEEADERFEDLLVDDADLDPDATGSAAEPTPAAETAPEPVSEPVPEPEPAAEPPARRKKRKISFV